MRNAAAAKARLELQLGELEGRQDRIARELAAPLNPDSSEQAVEMEDNDSLKGQAALVAREIASVKRALMRIEHAPMECVRGAALKSYSSGLRSAGRQHCVSNARAKKQ